MAKRETLEEVKIRLSESFDIRVALQEENSKLRKQLESKLDSVDMVSKVDYDGLIKQMEKIQLVADQYKRLHDEIEYKYTCLKNEHEGLTIRFNTVESQLLGEQGKTKTGRKRKLKVDMSDADIIARYTEVKSLRDLSKEIGLSINTIRDILKGVSK